MNIDDSDQMRSNLESSGFVFSDNYLESDIIIINTCTVREKPEKKLSYFLDSIKNLKKKNKNLVVVVTGCVAQQKGKEILDKYPVDIVLGVDNYYKLLEHYNHVLINREKIIDLDFSDTFGYKDLEPNSVNIKNSSAYLTVVKGCNNFCSYCIVPYVRGREKSRLSSEILENVKHLINSGISSITLLGQNIARFGIDNGENLSDLLYKISDIKGLKRLSFLTTHPKDFSADIADCFRNIKNLTPMLHLPIQHGSNKSDE
jgi:tRNA-2-methylthio-N6-dimethylallyladenosine synthase